LVAGSGCGSFADSLRPFCLADWSDEFVSGQCNPLSHFCHSSGISGKNVHKRDADLWYLCYRFGFDIDGIGFRRLRPEPVLVSASLIARQIDNTA
jgi:hypothetical protein